MCEGNWGVRGTVPGVLGCPHGPRQAVWAGNQEGCEPWEEGPGPPPPPLPGPLAQPQASALATVKASIISELSSKLQQFGGSSAAGGALPWARGGSGGSGDSHHGGASYVPERTSSLQRQR